MVDLEAIIGLASMTYIINLDAYDWHPGDEKFATSLSMNDRVWHYKYDRGSLSFKSICIYSC
jgi:hypothetical protein